MSFGTRRISVFLCALALVCARLTFAYADETVLHSIGTASEPVPQGREKAADIEKWLKDVKAPTGFGVRLFALVPGARDLAVSADGSKVFVGTNADDVYVLSLFGPEGPVQSVRRFAPSIAKKMSHGVCFGADGTLYVVELNRILAFPDAAANADNDDLTAKEVVPRGKLIPVSEESPYHAFRACRVGPDGKLYVTIGQHLNVPTSDQWAFYEKAGLGAIIRMNTDGSAREIYATGIRNSVGLDFNPKDQTLWFTDNQVDHMGDDIPPGEINRVTRPGQHFGFPWYGGGHVRTKEFLNVPLPKEVQFPEIEMVAHAADLGMTFYRGGSFPDSYRGGIFSVQHGSWDRSTTVGGSVMFTTLKADGTGDKTETFAEGWLAPKSGYHGRPVDVAELSDGSLLISDDYVGALYRISFDGLKASQAGDVR